VGSPRRSRSTSLVLGCHLLERWQACGIGTAIRNLREDMAGEEGRAGLLAAAREADLLVLASPVYVDSLPAHVISALELLAAVHEGGPAPPAGRRARLLAVCNSGFPEAEHCAVALDICRRFAQEAGLHWSGGLALGGGGIIDGQPLEARGFLTRRLRRGLDLTADALAAGEDVPDEAVQLLARPLLPPSLFRFVATRNFRAAARKSGVLGRLADRPYASAAPDGDPEG
jgi:hypothetical protein